MPSSHRFRFASAGLLLSFCFCSLALAQNSPEGKEPPEAQNSREAQEPPEDRPVPDYDGREESTSVGEVLLWVPRILLSPLYLTSEFVIRRPLGALTSSVEENQVPEKLVDLFTFGSDGQTVIVPTALVDFGFGPNVGIYIRSKDIFFEDNTLAFHYGFGGLKWHTASLSNAYSPTGAPWEVELVGEFDWRPDGLYHGIGKDSPRDESRFTYQRRGGELRYRWAGYLSSHVEIAGGVRSMDFDEETECDVSIAERIATGQLTDVPPGFGGYDALRLRVSGAFDTRPERPAPGTGIRLAAQSLYGEGLGDYAGNRWLRFGGEFGVFLDVSDSQHIVHLSLHAHDIVHAQGVVPFAEMFEPSSMEILRGFRPGRLYGQSTVAGVFEYTWPVWIFMDGFFHAALGNVFDQHFKDFAFEDLRLSTGMGFRTTGSRDHALELMVGFGTRPIREGAKPESIRFLVGGTSAF